MEASQAAQHESGIRRGKLFAEYANPKMLANVVFSGGWKSEMPISRGFFRHADAPTFTRSRPDEERILKMLANVTFSTVQEIRNVHFPQLFRPTAEDTR